MKRLPRKPTPPLIAVEVTTTYLFGSNRVMKVRIVAARSVSSAVDGLKEGYTIGGVKLMDNEEIVHAKQLSELVIVDYKRRLNGSSHC